MEFIEQNSGAGEPLALGGRGVPGKSDGSISGTQWAALLGASKYRGPHDLWLRIKGLEAPTPENEAMRNGVRLEPIVCALGEMRLGLELREPSPPTERWVRPYSNFTASIDRVAYDRDGRLIGPFEAKTMGSFGTWGEAGPPAYRIQLQSYIWAEHLKSMANDGGPIDVGWLGCLNAPSEVLTMIRTVDDAVFAVERGSAAFHLHQFGRDETFITKAVPYALDWWDRHIEGNNPPTPDASDACTKALRAHYGWTDDEIEATPEIEALVIERAGLADQIKAMTEAKKLTDNKIRGLLAGAKKAKSGRVSVTLSRVKGRTKFDEAKFKESHPDMHEDYLIETSGFEKFTVKVRDDGG